MGDDVTAQPVPDAREPLSKERVLLAAVDLADRKGLAALTMRNLADDLGVEAMSLYYHVANKEAILDGVVDVIIEEIQRDVASLELPEPSLNWKQDMRTTILTARKVLLRHPWIPPVIETRAVLSFPVIAYHDNLLRLMRDGGFSWDLAHHSIHALGSRGMGFSQELFTPTDTTGDEAMPPVEEMMEVFPNIVGMLGAITHDPADPSLGWCDDQTEFEFALDILLDGMETLRLREQA